MLFIELGTRQSTLPALAYLNVLNNFRGYGFDLRDEPSFYRGRHRPSAGR